MPFAPLASVVVYRQRRCPIRVALPRVVARLVCCGLGFASHLIDLLLNDRILSLHGVLDDLGLFHLHCVKVVLGLHVHNLFNGSLLDLVLRFPIFGWSLRVRDLLCDFRNSGDLFLLRTESEESRSNRSD